MKTKILLLAMLICSFLFLPGQSNNGYFSGNSYRDSIPGQIRERKAYKRAEWFFNQRAFPYDTIPNIKYQKVLMGEISKNQKQRGNKSNFLNWACIGPYGSLINLPSCGVVSGRVKAVAVHPTDPQTVYIGTASGGIWKTTDGGNTWLDVGSGLASFNFGAIAIDPNNPETIYAGTGESMLLDGFNNYSGIGLYKTSDGGLNWDLITDGFGSVTHFGDLAISPYNSNVLLAAVGGGIVFTGHDVENEGVWKSTDGGIRWNKTLDMKDVSDVAFHPTDPTKVFAAAGGYFKPMAGFFVSTDQGETWASSNTGLSLSSIGGRMQFDISLSNPNIIYAVIYSLNDNPISGDSKAYKSVDYGNSWTQISVGTNLGGYYDQWYDQGYYDLCIAVDPANPNHVLIGNIELHRTTNGNNFVVVRPNGTNAWGSLVHPDYHQLVFAPSNPDILYIGCDGGIYKSLDKGYTATSKNQGLSTLQFYRIASHPTNSDVIMGGMQDNMSTITHNGGSSWNRIFGGDGMECFFDKANPDNILYGSWQNGGLLKSNNGGATHALFYDAKGAWTTPFFAHPDNNNTLYTANKKIYKSTNAGASFSAISGPTNVTTSNISSMAQNQKYPQKMIISTGIDYPPFDTIFFVMVSDDEGLSWIDVTAYLPGETRWISRVATDPIDPNTMYVLRTGFSEGNKVWKTINRGLTWTNISGNLPDLPSSDLFIDPENTKHLYVANDVGVYHSGDGGISWEYASEGIPYVPAIDFDYVKIGTERYLRVGTHGRSIYQTLLPNYCLANGITFTTQDEIDNFQTNYPGCTDIEGDVTIGISNGEDIINLNGLSELTSIGGNLTIYWNLALTSLAGLDELNSVGGNFEIYWNMSLTNLAGLEGLTSIGGSLQIGHGMGGNGALINLAGLDNVSTIGGDLIILQNWELISFTGLNNLTSVGGGLSIIGNSTLTEIADLNNLTSIGGDINIYENFSLTSLNGLEGLTSIPGSLNLSTTGDFILVGNPLVTNLSGLANIVMIGGDLKINANHSLTNLVGLDNLISIGGNLILADNNSLISLSGLENLTNTGGIQLGDVWQGPLGNPVLNSISALKNLDAGSISNLSIIYNNILSTCDVQSICDYLSAPNGTIEIHDNAPGCNSQEEVEQACLVLVESYSSSGNISIFPNPADKTLMISSKNGSIIHEVTIYNQTGQKVYHEIPESNTLDISKLQPGMYVVEVVMKEGNVRKKLVVQ